MATEDWNVKQYRGPHENDAEWDLRRSFLVEHHGAVPLPRLICLSNCFINVEVYGCAYPAAVMQELREMTADLNTAQDFRTSKKAMLSIKFMKPEGEED